jgi:hypothetical protein
VNEKNLAASSNPTMANDLLAKAIAEPIAKVVKEAEITEPSLDTLVLLPGGHINSAGEVIKTAEVRELNGKDEELVNKSPNLTKAFNVVLERAVVSIGDEKVTPELLDKMLVGDRDALLLGIYKATFGPTAELSVYCSGCSDIKDVEVDVDRDIEVRKLSNPIADREFTVQGKNNTYLVTLPTGTTQKELINNSDKTVAELNTILLEQTVLEINEQPVISKLQIQNMGIADRRKIGDELAKRTSGPQFNEVSITCPDCEGKVVVPINLGALFRF